MFTTKDGHFCFLHSIAFWKGKEKQRAQSVGLERGPLNRQGSKDIFSSFRVHQNHWESWLNAEPWCRPPDFAQVEAGGAFFNKHHK